MEDLIEKVERNEAEAIQPNATSLQKASARKRTTRTETKAFMKWYLSENIQEKCKDFTNGRIGQEYLAQTGIDIKPACINYNKSKWIIHGGDLVKKSLVKTVEPN